MAVTGLPTGVPGAAFSATWRVTDCGENTGAVFAPSLSAMVMVCFTPITAPSSIAVTSMLSPSSMAASSTAVTVAFAETSPAASVSVLAVTV